MKFILLISTDPEPDGVPEAPGDIDAWFAEIENYGKHLDGDRLRPAAQSKIVRVRAGKRMVADGPFAETKEQIVGFDILDCASIEDAIEIAAKHPMARAGRIEVRAFWPFDA